MISPFKDPTTLLIRLQDRISHNGRWPPRSLVRQGTTLMQIYESYGHEAKKVPQDQPTTRRNASKMHWIISSNNGYCEEPGHHDGRDDSKLDHDNKYSSKNQATTISDWCPRSRWPRYILPRVRRPDAMYPRTRRPRRYEKLPGTRRLQDLALKT